MSPFETVDHLTVYKTEWNKLSASQKKAFNIFMTNKTLSMTSDNIDVVNLIQYYGRTTSIIPSKNLYQMYLNILPNKKMHSRYVKKTVQKYNKELLSILAEYYQLSRNNIKSYVDILDPDAIGHILYSLGYDDKTIKKLLK